MSKEMIVSISTVVIIVNLLPVFFKRTGIIDEPTYKHIELALTGGILFFIILSLLTPSFPRRFLVKYFRRSKLPSPLQEFRSIYSRVLSRKLSRIKNQREDAKFFAEAVGSATIRRRAREAIALTAIAAGSYLCLPRVSLWCEAVLSIGSTVLACDCLVVWLRLREGAYGDNDMEVLEAASFVLRQRSSGQGPGRYQQVFSPTRLRPNYVYGEASADVAEGSAP
jgi:hypothetical protein